MICLLAEPEDHEALWLATELTRLGEHVEIVLPEELMVGCRLTYRLETRQTASLLALHDGRLLGERNLALVVNRISDVPGIRGVDRADATYLAEEWRAALTAWLRLLPCPVLNPPRAAALAGPVLPTPAWRAAAHAHGLACRPWRSGHDQPPGEVVELVTLGDACYARDATAPEAVIAGLAALARASGVPLLGSSFTQENGGWLFVDATAHPTLSIGGDRLLDAVLVQAHNQAVDR